MSLEVKRTKQKLKILTETDNLSWVISDIIRETERSSGHHVTAMVVEAVRRKYLLYIQENEKKNLEQKEIEFDDR